MSSSCSAREHVHLGHCRVLGHLRSLMSAERRASGALRPHQAAAVTRSRYPQPRPRGRARSQDLGFLATESIKQAAGNATELGAPEGGKRPRLRTSPAGGLGSGPGPPPPQREPLGRPALGPRAARLPEMRCLRAVLPPLSSPHSRGLHTLVVRRGAPHRSVPVLTRSLGPNPSASPRCSQRLPDSSAALTGPGTEVPGSAAAGRRGPEECAGRTLFGGERLPGPLSDGARASPPAARGVRGRRRVARQPRSAERLRERGLRARPRSGAAAGCARGGRPGAARGRGRLLTGRRSRGIAVSVRPSRPKAASSRLASQDLNRSRILLPVGWKPALSSWFASRVSWPSWKVPDASLEAFPPRAVVLLGRVCR